MGYYDYIAHYGIRGMQKGVRRWTNEDGTLNEAGKERYKRGNVLSRHTTIGEIRVNTKVTPNGGMTSTFTNQRGKPVFTSSNSTAYHKTEADLESEMALHRRIESGKKAVATILGMNASSKVGAVKKASVDTINKGKKLISSLLSTGKKKRIFPSKRVK